MKYKLVIFDMDGVIFDVENFWIKVHEVFNTLEEGKILTKKYLHTNYDKLVEEVVEKLWKGKNAKPYFELINSIKYIEGAKELFEYLKTKNYKTAIISGGSIHLAERAKKDLKVDYIFANELKIKDNVVTGEFLWPIGAGKEKKVEIIKSLCSKLNIKEKEVIYIGDTETDLEAFKIVGLAIAFNPKSKILEEKADITIKEKNLKKIIEII